MAEEKNGAKKSTLGIPNLSVSQKILLLIGVTIASLFMATYFVVKGVQENMLLKQARSISEQVVTFRRWVAGTGAVWTKDTYNADAGYLLKEKFGKGEIYAYKDKAKLGEVKKTTFYAHNPALATRELSYLIPYGTNWKFRVVSDRYIAIQDKPDKWEQKALRILESHKEKTAEYYEWTGDSFRYAKALIVRESCLKCHGDPEHINPLFKKAIIAKYGEEAFKRASGYKLGEIRGIISVRIKPEGTFALMIGSIGFWYVGIVVALFGLTWYFVRREFIKPLESILEYAEKISRGKFEKDINVEEFKGLNVRNEIIKLAIAIDRIRHSIQIALKKLKR